MGKIVLNRDADTDKAVNLRIKMPLLSNDDIVVEERSTIQTKSFCEVSCTNGMLDIEVQGKLKRGSYDKVLEKAYKDKDIYKIIKKAASTEQDSIKKKWIPVYNDFRLCWIGVALNDETRCTETVLPTAIGASNFYEEVDNALNIYQAKTSGVVKTVAKESAKLAVAVPVEGAAVVAAVGAVTGAAAPIMLPIGLVAILATDRLLLTSVDADIVKAMVENISKLLSQPNIAEYVKQNDIEGLAVFRELDNISRILGNKKLTELEDVISDVI